MSQAHLDAFLNACKAWSGDTPDETLLEASRQFMSLGDAALLCQAAEHMPALPPHAAAWVAVTCGSAIESGAPVAAQTAPHVLALYRAWLPELPADRARLRALSFLSNALVSHLAHAPELRDALGSDTAFLDRLVALRDFDDGPQWVHTALLKRSGDLIVLHVHSQKGLRIRYENVANCFHLFSLIQSCIGTQLPGGRRPDDRIATVARGLRNEPVKDEAWWHYAQATEPTPAPMIDGKAPVDSIAEIDGTQIILLWPAPSETRGWDASFLTPHIEAMPAEAAIEEVLDRSDVLAWFAHIGIKPETLEEPPASMEKKPWWKPW